MALGTELGLYSVWNGEPKTFVSKGASELRFTSDSGEADGYTETLEVGRPRGGGEGPRGPATGREQRQ